MVEADEAAGTLENWPDQIRADDVPAQVRPFQPLFKSVAITATLDLGKTIDLDVRVRTGTVTDPMTPSEAQPLPGSGATATATPGADPQAPVAPPPAPAGR